MEKLTAAHVSATFPEQLASGQVFVAGIRPSRQNPDNLVVTFCKRGASRNSGSALPLGLEFRGFTNSNILFANVVGTEEQLAEWLPNVKEGDTFDNLFMQVEERASKKAIKGFQPKQIKNGDDVSVLVTGEDKTPVYRRVTVSSQDKPDILVQHTGSVAFADYEQYVLEHMED